MFERKSQRIKDISAAELHEYMEAGSAGRYELIDVRELKEYSAEHIPGARHLPLSELEQRISEIDSDKQKIFYCHSGRRSLHAAGIAKQALPSATIHNLAGGIIGWSGHKVPDIPKLGVFSHAHSVPEILLKAIELEKGTLALYEALGARFSGTRLADTLHDLAAAEAGHGFKLYKVLQRQPGVAMEPYEKLFARLDDSLLESGESLVEWLNTFQASGDEASAALLDLALDLEYQAYDLFMAAAHHSGQNEEKAAFTALADEEKQHVRAVLRTFGQLVAREGGGEA